MRKTIAGIGTLLLLVGLLALPASAAQNSETIPLLSQDDGGRTEIEGGTTTLTRSNAGLTIKVVMPTPEPGSYNYPDGADDDGSPEAFSLWAFVFANPEECDGPCSGLDDVVLSGGGVFNVAGHMSGGGQLVLSGHISKNTAPFEPPAYVGQFKTLTSAATAEVHVAVAPHGTVDPANLPAQITTPIGSPPLWWVSIFK